MRSTPENSESDLLCLLTCLLAAGFVYVCSRFIPFADFSQQFIIYQRAKSPSRS